MTEQEDRAGFWEPTATAEDALRSGVALYETLTRLAVPHPTP
jgi:hypothetical protein